MMQETTPRTKCSQEQLLVLIIKNLLVFSLGRSGLLMFKKLSVCVELGLRFNGYAW
jgi:hypothetical protein